MRRPSLRRVIWVSGTAWIVSWTCLGLEIFHWHHVTKTLRLNPPKALPGHPKPQPGLFLLSVLAASALAPAVFLMAVAAGSAQPRTRERRRVSIPTRCQRFASRCQLDTVLIACSHITNWRWLVRR
jgi:hypothetical protein